MHFAFITGCDSDGIRSERVAHCKALILLMKGLTFLFTPSGAKYILFASIAMPRQFAVWQGDKFESVKNVNMVFCTNYKSVFLLGRGVCTILYSYREGDCPPGRTDW